MQNTHLIISLLSVIILAAYAFHILLFTYGWMKLSRKIINTRSVTNKGVSVVVALRNEKDNIYELIKNLKDLDFPKDRMEILLMDDYSSDGSKEYAEQLITEWEMNYARLISLEEIGVAGSKKSAVETAVSLAAGEYIVVTDADCRFEKEWLSTMVDFLEATGAKLIAGPVKPQVGIGFSGKFRELEFLSLSGTGAGSIGAGMPIFCNGANMAFTKEAFEAVGGYYGNKQFSSGDDVFLLHKVRKEFGSEAIRFVLDRKAVVNTFVGNNWKSFLGQRVRWASKTRGYRNLLSVTTAVSVFLMNVVLIAVFIFGFIQSFYFYLFGYLFMMKIMTDTPVMTGITGFYKRQKLLRWLLLFELLYIPYVTVAGFTSVFYGGRWKGRQVDH